MENNSSDEIVSPLEMLDASIILNASEVSDVVHNGTVVTAGEIKSKLVGRDVTASMEDKCSVPESFSQSESACVPVSESLSNETVSIFKTDVTIESDDFGTKKEEINIETENEPEFVSTDCENLELSNMCNAACSLNNESVPSIASEAVQETDQSNEENKETPMDLNFQEQDHCHSDALEDNVGSSKMSLALMLDDDEDEEECHERFLRIDTVEKPLGDGRNEAGKKMASLKRCMKEDGDGGCSSSSTTSSSVVLAKDARLVFRNLPMNYTSEQIKELLQKELPPDVLLGEFSDIVEGRAEVVVSPSNTAEQAARQLHDIMIGDCKISVRKLITVDTADPVLTPASIPSSTATTHSEAVQARCDHKGCVSLVMQGDVHTQCCSHSICFAAGVFDPASCPHCISVFSRALTGDLLAKRLWRNRIHRMRKKHIQWVSEAVRRRFLHPNAMSRNNVTADTGLAESAGLGILVSSSSTSAESSISVAPTFPEAEGGDDTGGASLGRTRDRSAERILRAQEMAELGSLVVATKPEMLRRSKGTKLRVTINNIAFGFSLKKMMEILQDIGQVSFMMPRFGSLVVEFTTAEAATTCQERMDKTAFMGRKLSVTLHGEANRTQQQQKAASSPEAADSSSQAPADGSSVPLVQADVETGDTTPPADGCKISTELQARLSTAQKATALGTPTDNADAGQVASTSIKDRLLKPGSLTDTFNFSPHVLESLNITLPIVKELSVSNLNERVTAADVRELFSVAGYVAGVQYNKARGTAVVEMRHPVEAVQAISLLHAQFYHNKSLKVVLHRPNGALHESTTAPPLPKGLQTIGKRLSIDKTLMAALTAGLTTPLQPSKQRPQKTNSIEKRLHNNAPSLARRQQTGASPAQRKMNGSTAAEHQKSSGVGQQHNNAMGQQQNISTSNMPNASSGSDGPRGLTVGGGAPHSSSHDHTHGGSGQTSGVGGDGWTPRPKRGVRRFKRQASNDVDLGNPAKRTNPYWGAYRGPNPTGNSSINSLASKGNYQNSHEHAGPTSGSKYPSNYARGNSTGNSNNYSTLNRYTGSTASTASMAHQYSGSGPSTDWNSGHSSSWNDSYSNWNWQQQSGDAPAYGSSSTPATPSYSGTAPTGYSDNTSASGYGATNTPYGTGAVRGYSNSTNNNSATPSYGGSASSALPSGYGGNPTSGTYCSSAGVDGPSASYSSAPGGSGAYESSGYYNSSGPSDTVGVAGAQSTAWEGQPTAKVPKYNNDGSFAGFS